MSTNMLVTVVTTKTDCLPYSNQTPALEANSTYLVHIEGVFDLTGNTLSEPFQETFNTGL